MSGPNDSVSLLNQKSLLVNNAAAYKPLGGEFTSLKDEFSSLQDAVSSLKDGVSSLEDEMRLTPMRLTNYSLTSDAAIFWPNGMILPPGSPTTKDEISHASGITLRAVLQALGVSVAPGAGQEVMQTTLCDYLGVRM